MRQQPSLTAQSIAVNMVLLSYDPLFGRLVDPESVEILRWLMKDMPGRTGRAVRGADSAFRRRAMRAVESFFIPGISLHQALRKRWIEERVRAALRNGATQVVALGAGFDPLLYRLHRAHPEARFYEIEHPATYEAKQSAITKYGDAGANLTVIPADFTQTTLARVLESTPGYDREAATAFTAEGVLMYLTGQEVRVLLQTLRAYSAAGSPLIGTLIEPDPADGRLHLRGSSRIVDAAMKSVGEPLKWGIAPGALHAFLASEGFTLTETETTRAALATFAPDAPAGTKIPEGEYLFAARAS